MPFRRRPIPKKPVVKNESEPHQFQFDITEANGIDDQVTTSAEVPPSNGDSQQQDLTSDQLQQLFARASTELVGESSDEQDFFKREASIKAPKTSKEIQTPFPPPAEDRKEVADIDPEQLKQLAKQGAGPLIIERYSPNQTEIDHSLATVTITFNQPMISVSTVDENINTQDLGISLTPALEGRWRWTGTKTIQFEANHRFPYSTKYTLKVNKDTCVSTIGGK